MHKDVNASVQSCGNIYMNIALRLFLHNHGNIATQESLKLRLCPTLISNDLEGLFILHSTIGSTVHSMPLNSLEHCICTTTVTNTRPDWDSNLVPPGYKPQSIRMCHRGRPAVAITTSTISIRLFLTRPI